jgi:carbon monoxide dehydrogenase subunit G
VPIKTEETFQLKAPADRVWAYLIDPRHVVTCLPGAELTSVQDESTFLGKVKVKVGPVVAAYSGKVVITERDDSARVVRMVGEGRESAGSGSAKVAISSSVVALPDGMTEVRVTADLDVVGKIAQFGRGMIESVNKQMFKQFTECVRATLETADASPTVPAPPGEVPGAPLAPVAPSANVVAPLAPPASATATPVRLLPLIGRALWDFVTGFIRRLTGRRSESSR